LIGCIGFIFIWSIFWAIDVGGKLINIRSGEFLSTKSEVIFYIMLGFCSIGSICFGSMACSSLSNGLLKDLFDNNGSFILLIVDLLVVCLIVPFGLFYYTLKIIILLQLLPEQKNKITELNKQIEIETNNYETIKAQLITSINNIIFCTND
jgi:hypothetical protein